MLNYARDSATWRPEVSELVLDVVHAVGMLHEAVEGCRAPDGFLLDVPAYPLEDSALPEVTVSNLVMLRCERLGMAEQLVSAYLVAIEHGDLSVAALTARAMVEMAADTLADADAIRSGFETVTRDGLGRDALESRENALYRAVNAARYAGRMDTDYGAPKKRNVLTALGKPDTPLRIVYDELSELCHPNAQAAAQYWRRAHRLADGTRFVPFTPARGGESPAKVSVLNGPWSVAWAVVPFARDAWRMASILTLELGLHRSPHAQRCGFPIPAERNAPCVCGSGKKGKVCDHPTQRWPPARPGSSTRVPPF
jgi:hypothetical protein